MSFLVGFIAGAVVAVSGIVLFVRKAFKNGVF